MRYVQQYREYCQLLARAGLKVIDLLPPEDPCQLNEQVAYEISKVFSFNRRTLSSVELTLDGLFLMLAEEERKIRQNPAARVTDLLKEVFGKQ
jgi:hypothetical protein